MHKLHALSGALLLSAVACNTGDINLVGPTVAPPPPGLNLSPQIAVTPSTVPARPSTDPALQWEVAFEVSLTDVARRGIRVEVALIEIRDAAGALVFEKSFAELLSGFDGRVAVGETARWPLEGIRYSLPGGGRTATGNVHLEMETGVGDFRTMNFGFPIS